LDDHLYLVTYDIADTKRWRAIYDLMNGYGDWLQLSVFQCRLTRRRRSEMVSMLDQLIHHTEDHVLIIDLGTTESVSPKVVSLGKETYKPVVRQAVIV
jgi:CRISPR-associated protein Cas2